MLPLEGYDKATPRQICKLRKSLYVLKQASRQWNSEFSKSSKMFGFIQSAHEHCPFIYQSASTMFLALLVYVDDVVITGTSKAHIAEVNKLLHTSLITIKDLGYAKYFLGLEIARNSKRTHINKQKYVLDIVGDTGLMRAKSVSIPFPKVTKFLTASAPLLPDLENYLRLIGS